MLLDTIKEFGLDPKAILGELKFGLDANIEDLVTAMASAVEAISAQIGAQLGAQVPGLGAGLIDKLPVAAGAGGGTVSITFNPVINSEMDMVTFEQRVKRVVTDAVGA